MFYIYRKYGRDHFVPIPSEKHRHWESYIDAVNCARNQSRSEEGIFVMIGDEFGYLIALFMNGTRQALDKATK